MKIDPYNHEARYRIWQQRIRAGIPELSKANEEWLRRFIGNMELGLNVRPGTKRGPRSFIRLNTLKDRTLFFCRRFEERFGIDDIARISEEQLHRFFADMRSGEIRRNDGKLYTSIIDLVKDFKTFWHWYMLVRHKEGETVADITLYLDTSKTKPPWVYLTEEQVQRLCAEAKYEYRVLIMFLIDSGIRSPSELVNIRVGDLSDDFRKLHIRDEISKTFGRKINLMLCNDLLREYVATKGLTEPDCVFAISPAVTNRYLRRLAARVLGDGMSPGGERYDKLTMYDFRHNSACFWLPRYKSESALKYRFGWKKSERIHYYTELLGMKDDITKEDLLVDTSKTEIEQRLQRAEQDRQLLRERIDGMQDQMARIMQATERLLCKIA